MKRVIIDYKKLNRTLVTLLIDSYPHGYGDDDIILLRKPSGDIVEAVEIKTEDTVYLVKISKSLSNFISNFEETMSKELEHTHGQMIAGNDGETDLRPEMDSDLDISEDLY